MQVISSGATDMAVRRAETSSPGRKWKVAYFEPTRPM